MIRKTMTFLAVLVFPAICSADEKPLWEAVTRIHGNDQNVQVDELVKTVLSGVNTAEVLGDNTVIRMAGFENAATPQQDWVAEIKGLNDTAALLKRLGVAADAQGRYVVEEEGLSFVVWRDGESGLRLASPPANAGVVVTPVVQLKTGESLAAWVDLSRLEQDVIQSKSLKLPKAIGLSASIEGEKISAEIVAEMASEELVEMMQKLFEEMQSELEKVAIADGGAAPKLVTTAEGKKLKVSIAISDKQLDLLMGEVTNAFEKP